MKKATVHITVEEEKLSAAKLYMEQKGLSFEKELEKAADVLYTKYVPTGVLEYLELSTGMKSAPKVKKPKESSSKGGESV